MCVRGRGRDGVGSRGRQGIIEEEKGRLGLQRTARDSERR